MELWTGKPKAFAIYKTTTMTLTINGYFVKFLNKPQ